MGEAINPSVTFISADISIHDGWNVNYLLWKSEFNSAKIYLITAICVLLYVSTWLAQELLR